MKSTILVLLLCETVLGGGLRKLSAMELASDPVPVAVADNPVAAAPDAAAVGIPTAPVEATSLPPEASAPPAALAPVAAAPSSLLAAIESPATPQQTPIQEWAASVAKKTTDEALLTMFDVAAQLKAVYKTFDLNADGTVDASELAAITKPVASMRRKLTMELAAEPLPEQVVMTAELPPAAVAALAQPPAPVPAVATAVLADTPLPVAAVPAAAVPAAPVATAPAVAVVAPAAPVAVAAPAAPVAVAAPAAPVAAPLAAAPVAAAPAVAVAPAVVAAPAAAVPLSAGTSVDARLSALFGLIEKMNAVHAIFDADSDGAVSASDLIKIAKGPATAA